MPTHPKTIKSFSEKSHQYLRDDCDELPFTERLDIRELIGDVAGKKVLFAGCGAGAECSSLAALGAQVSGVDSSPSLLEIAKTRNPGMNFTLASLESLPFPDACFDLIYCGHVLHYLDNWTPALGELKRVTAAGGTLVVTVHHPADHGYTGDQPKEVHATWYDDFDVVYYPRSIAEMTNTFASCGLTTVKVLEIAGEAEGPPIAVAFRLIMSC